MVVLSVLAGSLVAISAALEPTSLSTAESWGTHKVMGNAHVGSPNGDNILWDNGLPDLFDGFSCVLRQGYWDREVVDDFDVPEPGWDVTDGHFRIITYNGSGPEIIDGVRVFFYKDIGNQPSPVRYAEIVDSYNAYLTGNISFGRPEIAVDCTFGMLTLAPGKWWVCFQPEMEDNSLWLTAAGSGETVWASHPDLGYPKWTNGSTIYYNDDVSFQLTGRPAQAVPTPALTPTGLIALVSALSAITAVAIVRKRR
jgi:hypothetical protein